MCNCLQAITSVLLVFLTGATLYVLWGYAKDTKRIAEDSAAQVERAQMPFLAVVQRLTPAVSSHPDNWFIENQGFGTAINITRSRHFNDGRDSEIMSIPSPLYPRGQDHHLDGETAGSMGMKGFFINYESLSGRKYRTEIVYRNGLLRTVFHKLDEKK
jgi:hypothetical protein